jgi:hypothetical protein
MFHLIHADNTTPSEAVVSKKFLDRFTAEEYDTFKFAKQQDASNQLDFYNVHGYFREETNAIIELLTNEIHFSIAKDEINHAVLESLIYLARGDNYSFYVVYPTPFTGDAYEPNNPMLIGDDGKITIIISRGGRMDSGPVYMDPSLRSFCNYWNRVVELKQLNHADKLFLDNVNFLKESPLMLNVEARLNLVFLTRKSFQNFNMNASRLQILFIKVQNWVL